MLRCGESRVSPLTPLMDGFSVLNTGVVVWRIAVGRTAAITGSVGSPKLCGLEPVSTPALRSSEEVMEDQVRLSRLSSFFRPYFLCGQRRPIALLSAD